ncbi:hypothetical protein OZN62_07790 [Aurantiacibacter sp. MUD11]|uniref:hypothetical protein n=1 Tax=Aurantiacibacter sp. MUD11 TaxID=3003265 RepID=UPI0022AA9FB1|nr:hypothetical protein [Aurantiacibacter sp. MUD11]WAT16846.1 hypothetical protein OZN62_07790 [Aurantiacibacter sp. MUD11]
MPASAAAQDEVPSAFDEDEREIVVTGSNERITTGQVQRQVRDIVVRTGNMFESPLARWEDRLCPGTIGLEEDFAFALNARIRANADALGIRLMDDDCRPNFIIVFTEDGGQMLADLMDSNPEYFQYLNSGQKNDILEPGPVHVWTGIEPRTLTGMPIAQVRNLVNPPVMQVSAAHTRIYTTIRNDITTVMITFDRDAVRGMSLRQLADYATMRGLAQTRAPDEPVMDSILTLFDVETPPLGMTEFDQAYLRSLYDGIPNLPGFRRVGGTTRQLRLMAEEAVEMAADSDTGTN